MEALLASQISLHSQLNALKRNYSKTSVERRTRGYVTKRIQDVDTLWATFNANDANLRNFEAFEKTTYAIDNLYDPVVELYSIFSGELADALCILDRADQVIIQNGAAHAAVNAQVPAPRANFRLPQISLPTFSGDYETWSAFYDMFVSLIHSNDTLSNVQKLHYLKCNLSGQAAALLRHTAVTNDNYDVAWALLQHRFANKKSLVDVQLKGLFNQSKHSCESAANVRELIDRTQESMNALHGLEINTTNWDPLLLFILVQKLSADTHTAWEQSQIGVAELPTFNNFIAFLESRFRMLETLASRNDPIPSGASAVPKHPRHVRSHAVTSDVSPAKACVVCAGNHHTRQCQTFLNMNVADRRNIAKAKRVCFNCLAQGHFNTQCRSQTRCQSCGHNHHTLLHTQAAAVAPVQPSTSHNAVAAPAPVITSSPARQSTTATTPVVSHTASHSVRPSTVLLATAIINAVSISGKIVSLRALIDQGSEVSFITENAAQLLQLKRVDVNLPIHGVGNVLAGRVSSVTQIDIRSPQDEEFALRADALIMRSITGVLPHARCAYSSWPHIANISLADPTFAVPGAIDVLLGADVYTHIMLPGMLKGAENAPLAQSTVFGWILSGVVGQRGSEITRTHYTALHTCIDIDSRLKRFWEIEELSSEAVPMLTDEERLCETHFASTHDKTPDGRYVVRLPLRKDAELGDSRQIAERRLLQMERRLSANDELRTSYVAFMREYESLGHMQLATPATNLKRYFIPHHAVFKESSSTTKVRVVFDASCKTTNGRSLNEIMLIGAKIQDDLSTTILRVRKFPVAYTADIEKMYRQVLIHPDDQRYQNILWRESPTDPIREYTLRTITYGTSCAPHLAVRTLQQLAVDNASAFPSASHAIRNDFYVDDFMSGSYTVADAIRMQKDVCGIMTSAGLKLRKWVSNCSTLLNEIPAEDREIQQPFSIDIDNSVTALGIIWNPTTDQYNFKLKLPADIIPPITKRMILSDISKLFDPLGWLAPIIVRCKIMMQQLWVKGVGWDDPLPETTVANWTSIRRDLFNVSSIFIDRWIRHHDGNIELHGFSDASTSAYAAVIYVRVLQPDGTHFTTLLTAKTRVAPLKQISIPRLELCGAVLVAELLQTTQRQLQIADSSVHAWTDSTIVLHWIHALPNKWKTFVANRVSTIQQIIPLTCWRHVPTASNPADCASRGIDTVTLQTHDLWWRGPDWLRHERDTWPVLRSNVMNNDEGESTEQRIVVNISTSSTLSTSSTSSTLSTSSELAEMGAMLESFSSFDRLVRVTAYCKRFINSCRKQSTHAEKTLTVDELGASLAIWIVISQRLAFHSERRTLLDDRALASNSKLRSLCPFIDAQQTMRVGGRLHNANVAYDEKHPIILSHKCHLTTLIIRSLHRETLHGGPQLVLSLLRRKYWVLNAKNTVRLHIHRCVKCHRYKAEGAKQLMGTLPEPRVNISRAFTHTGVDYAGPIDLRMSKGRGNASYKGYISIFVCLCTKAVHIEAVSDLTSSAFIAAYRRFVARRGLPSHMYSDNGTNFIGAEKELQKHHEAVLLQIKGEIIEEVTKKNTTWHFIPPASPHFGGLWEAGVKSLKHHMKRSVENVKLTYEELATLLAQIESCLNSRPLAPMTTDPNDLSALTPGHFLIGDALLAAPDRDTINENISLLNRWQLVQRLYHSFAKRWQTEYLSRLQNRPKWTTQHKNIEIGDLVLIKENNIPPAKWPLARIIATHPGSDNLVRVVSVRTASSTFKRCITKICPLPI